MRFKCFLLFLFSIIFSHSVYGREEVLIYDNKFYVESYLDLGQKFEIVLENKEAQIVDEKDFNYFIIKNSLNDNPSSSFINNCNSDCLYSILKKSLNAKDFKTASLMIILISKKDNSQGFLNKILENIEGHEIDDQKVIYNNIFSEDSSLIDGLKSLGAYLVRLSLIDSDLMLGNIINYAVLNEDVVIAEYKNLLKSSYYNENIVSLVNQISLVTTKLFGVSNKFSQELDIETINIKKNIKRIDNFSSFDSVKDFNLKFPNIIFSKNYLENYFIDAIYRLTDNAINKKNFFEAFNIILYIPKEKYSEKTIETINKITNNISFEDKFLDKEIIKRLAPFTKNNSWLLNKIVKIQSDRVEYFIENSDLSRTIIEIKNLTSLHPEDSYENEKIKIKIANYLYSNNEKSLGKYFYYNINSRRALLFSFDGLILLFKLYFTQIFLVVCFITLLYFTIRKIIKNAEHLKDTIKSKKKVQYDDQTIATDNQFKSNLSYFGISDKSPSVSTVKSAYRKKIKLIHPDILGHESKEFLEAQLKYHEILKYMKEHNLL